MRYTIAVILAAVLIVGLLVGAGWVQTQETIWRGHQNQALEGGQAFAAHVAAGVNNYWFVVFPAIVLVCLGAAAGSAKRAKKDTTT